jgi:hypothetical protein
MSDLFTMKKNSLFESISSIHEPTTLENIRNSINDTIPTQRYTNITDYSTIISSNLPKNNESYNKKIVLETKQPDEIDEMTSVVAYLDHPSISINTESIPSNNDMDNISPRKIEIETKENATWDGVTTFYVSAISVIGLYLMFKMIQKSK